MRKLDLDLQARIIEEAKKQFLDKGYAATSIRELAQVLNISKGNIYNYFTNKEALFETCIGSVIKQFDNALAAIKQAYLTEVKKAKREKRTFSKIETKLIKIFENSGVELDLLLNCSRGSVLDGRATQLEKITLLVTLEIFDLNNTFSTNQRLRQAQAELFAHNLIAGLLAIIRRNEPSAIHIQLIRTHIQIFNNGLKNLTEMKS